MAVNISSYSSDVVNGDWSPAVLAAITALGNGGQINIDTDIVLKSQIDIINGYDNFLFQGDLQHTITVDMDNPAHIAFYFGNHCLVTFKNVLFIGNTTQSATPECLSVIYAGYVDRLNVDNCLFAGIYASSTLIGGDAACEVSVTNSKFGGCGGTHITAYRSNGLHVINCEMYDYQNLHGLYFNRQGSRPTWIKASNPPAAASANSITYVNIENCRFDEGANRSIDIADYPRVNIERCSSNLGGNPVASYGIYLNGVERADIKSYWAGYSDLDRPSIGVTGCGYVTIDHLITHNGPHPIVIDADTTSVVIENSPTATVTAHSTAEYTLNGQRYRGSSPLNTESSASIINKIRHFGRR